MQHADRKWHYLANYQPPKLGWALVMRGQAPGEGLPPMELKEVRIDKNGREIKTVGTPMFPMNISLNDIQHYISSYVPWHWHAECELNVVIEGALDYEFAGGCECVHAGEAMFVNSDQIHAVRPHGDAKGVCYTVMLAPTMVSGSALSIIHTKYVLPVVRNENVPVLFFRQDAQGRRVVERLVRMAKIYSGDAFDREMQVRILLNEIWLDIAHSCLSATSSVGSAGSPYIKPMLAFIRDHYADSVALKDIADSAGVSVRTCCRVFREQLNTTVFGYLMEYRVCEAARMLAETNERITDIGYACGFSSPGYFTRAFRSVTGQTPSACRKELAGASEQILQDRH